MATEVKLPGSAWALSPRWLPWELAMVLKGPAAHPSSQLCVPFGYFLSPASALSSLPPIFPT